MGHMERVAAYGQRCRVLVGVCELPVVGVVQTPRSVLIRPDGYVASEGENKELGLSDALNTWFRPTRSTQWTLSH